MNGSHRSPTFGSFLSLSQPAGDGRRAGPASPARRPARRDATPALEQRGIFGPQDRGAQALLEVLTRLDDARRSRSGQQTGVREPGGLDLATAVGIRTVAGYLAGGMTSWHAEQRPTVPVERIDVIQLRAYTEDGLQVLDVRDQHEWETGHLQGALHTPYHDIHDLPAGLDPARPVAVICSSGQRSAVAASLLQRLGHQRVIHVADGGVGTWADNGWPLERSAIADPVA